MNKAGGWEVCAEVGVCAAALTLVKIAIERGTGDSLKRSTGDNCKKAFESAWRLAFYAFSSAWLLLAVPMRVGSPDDLWDVYTAATAAETLMYMLQLAWYAHQLTTHLFLDARRKDFWLMLAHHVATLLLIEGSRRLNYYRVGLMVMLAHDPCDVALDGAKLLQYLRRTRAAACVYVALVFCWAGTRLAFFPYLIYSLWAHAPSRVPNDCQGCAALGAMLALLQIFHIFWFVQILQVGWRALSSGPLSSGREYDVREQSSENTKK